MNVESKTDHDYNSYKKKEKKEKKWKKHDFT